MVFVDEVGPPVDSVGAIVVRYNFWFLSKFWKFEVFLEKSVKLLEASKCKLAEALLNKLELGKLRDEHDLFWEFI